MDMEATVWEDLGMAWDIAGMAILLTTLPPMDTAMVTSMAMVTAMVTARGRPIMTWWLRTE